MGSQLRTIYDNLARLPMMLDGSNVPCLLLEETTGVIHTTPQRVLSPLSERNEGQGAKRLSFGEGASVLWTITELVLLAGVEEGSGLEFHTPRLVAYQEEFISKYAKLDKTLGIRPRTVQVITADIEIGVYNYPLGTDNWYYGLKVNWSIRENIE